MEVKNIFFSALKKQKEKNLNEASNLYKKVLKLKPNHLNTIFNLATIYAQTNKYSDALKLFLKYTNLNSKNYSAYNDLGLTYFQLGKIEEAIKNVKKSIDLNPKYAEAYNNVGLMLSRNGQIEEAEKYCLKSYNLNPKSFATYTNLKQIYKIKGDFKNLEKLYLNTIKLNPKFFDTYEELMDFYERSHEEKKLEIIIKQVEKIFKKNNVVNLYKGKVLFKNQKFHEVISLLESSSYAKKSSEQTKFLILAKSYDKINKNEKAYENFSKMNQLSFQNKRSKINKDRYLNIVKERVNFFVEDKYKEWKLFKDDEKINNPVFLIGFPRSGTTLLDTILRSHPKIEIIEEKPIINEIKNELENLTNGNFLNLNKISLNDIKRIRESYFKNRLEFTGKESKDKIYIDKNPLNIIFVGEIIRVFPNAKFLFTLRNPYDCVLSCFMQDFLLNDAMANFININDAAILYNEIMKLWHQYLTIFQIQNYTVKYEGLVSNFEENVRKVLDFLNLEWSDSINKYQETAIKRVLISTPSYNQVTQPIYKQAVNRWKKYENKLENIKPIIDPWVKKFNYK